MTDDKSDEHSPDDGSINEYGEGVAAETGTDFDAGGSGAGGSGGAPASGLRSPKVLAAIAALVVVLAVVLGFMFTRGDDKSEPTPTRPRRAATTTTTEKLPSGVSEVATVKASLAEVTVLRNEPPSWSKPGTAIVPDTIAEAPPWSRESAPTRDPIPTELRAVTGRYVTPEGWRFKNPGPYEPAQPLTFLVAERRGDWLKVYLPVRPNGTMGYIPMSSVDLHETSKRIELRVGEHHLTAYDGTNRVVDTTVVTGVDNTPTPTGTFFVTDIIPQPNPAGFYGPFALATNGYSETLDEFDSGVPVIALHGTNHPEYMGQNRSNGCVRIENDLVSKLASDFGQGTPVFIWP